MNFAILDAEKLYPWIAPAVLLGLFTFTGLFLRRFIFRHIRANLSDEKTGASLFIDVLDHMFGFWLVLAGISAAAAAAPLDLKHEHLIHVLVRSGFLVSATFVFARLLSTVAESGLWFGTNWAMSRLISRVGGLLVVILGVLLLLSNLGVSITPLLTALGVGSLA